MNNDHPAPFPIALIERIISSTNAKIVLDPFIGSGTTAIAAQKLNRNYIGIEISQDYVNKAQLRNDAPSSRATRSIITISLTTLFHMEPSPTALKFVSCMLLPKYGWPHQEAGKKYSINEKSFRQTISTLSRSDRGFKVIVDKLEQKVLISFDAEFVADRHKEWLLSVEKNIGLKELDPQPYWGFQDLYHKAGTKIHNCFL